MFLSIERHLEYILYILSITPHILFVFLAKLKYPHHTIINYLRFSTWYQQYLPDVHISHVSHATSFTFPRIGNHFRHVPGREREIERRLRKNGTRPCLF